MLQNPNWDPQEQSGLCDIDWGNLFSAQNGLLLNGDAKDAIECASSFSFVAQNKGVCEEEKGNKEKRKGGRMKKTTRVPRFAFQTRSGSHESTYQDLEETQNYKNMALDTIFYKLRGKQRDNKEKREEQN